MVGELDSTTSSCENLSRTIELNDGSNDVIYTVVAEDGTPKSYTFKIVYDKDSQGNNENTNSNGDNSENTSLDSDNNSNNNESNGSTNPFIPFTGDNIIFYFAILLICVIIIGFVVLGLKKKKNNK